MTAQPRRRVPALEIVTGYSTSWVGFGEWDYLCTDHAFESGERAAQRVLAGP